MNSYGKAFYCVLGVAIFLLVVFSYPPPASGIECPEGSVKAWERVGGKKVRARCDCLEGRFWVDSKRCVFPDKTKVVTLTAKSWINPSTISVLTSLQGIKVRLDPNKEPVRPALVPGADDFKMYQRFVAEAKFIGGKVVSATFLEMEIQAGITFKQKGVIYEKYRKILPSKDGKSVTFTITVEAHPAILFVRADEIISRKKFRRIFNTLSVEIRSDRAIPHGYGSDFPSHKFWMGSTPLPEKKQVQPVDFFGKF